MHRPFPSSKQTTYRRLGEPHDRSVRVRKVSLPMGIRSPARSALSESLSQPTKGRIIVSMIFKWPSAIQWKRNCTYTHCVITQKRAVLSHCAVEAWTHFHIKVEDTQRIWSWFNNNNNNNNNNKYYIYLLHLGCHPVAVVILHVYKILNWLLINLSREGYMRSM